MKPCSYRLIRSSRCKALGRVLRYILVLFLIPDVCYIFSKQLLQQELDHQWFLSAMKNKMRIRSVQIWLQAPISAYKLSRALYISLKIGLREVNKRSKYFLFSVQFINFRNHYHDDVLRKLARKLACEQALRGALAVARREKEGKPPTSRSQMRIGGDDISNGVITLSTCFSMFAYIRARFCFALIGGNLIAQSTESHWGFRGGIQIPETQLHEAPLPFPAPPPERPGKLARRL